MKKILFVFATNRQDLVKDVENHRSPDNALYGFNYMQKNGYKCQIADVSQSLEKILDAILSPIHNLFIKQIDMDFKLARALLLLNQISRFDAIVVNTDGIGLAVCLLKRLGLVKPPIIYAVGLFYIRGGLEKAIKANKNTLFLKFYKWILNATDQIVYHAFIEKEKLIKLRQYNPARCTFLAMGSDGKFFKRRHSAQVDDRLIVSVGKDRARDYKTLFNAARKLPQFKFVVITRKTNIKNLRVPKNIKTYFDIPYEEVAKWYARSKIVLIPIREMHRSSGQMTLTDAIQANKPVIISDAVGISHYNLKDRIDVVKVPPQNVKELVKKIRVLMGNEKLYQKIQKRSRRLAKIFTTENYARQLRRVIDWTTDPITLSPISQHDLEFLRFNRNLYREFFLNNKYITRKNQLKWFKNYKKKTNDFMFVIIFNKQKIGAGAIYDIDHKNKRAKIGRFFILKEFHGKNYGKILLKKLEEVAAKLQIKTLELEVLTSNKIALNLYEKYEFQRSLTKKIMDKPVIVMTKKITN